MHNYSYIYLIVVHYVDRGDSSKDNTDDFFKQLKEHKDETGSYPPPVMVSVLVFVYRPLCAIIT